MSGYVGTDYQKVLQAVGDYYGTGSDVWQSFAQHSITASDLYTTLKPIPGVSVDLSADAVFDNNGNMTSGRVLGYSYSSPWSNDTSNTIASSINSNAGSVTNNTVNIPANMEVNQQSGNAEMSSGATGSGTSANKKFTVGTVSSVVGAAMTGAVLGKTITKALYAANPNWASNVSLYELNPSAWNAITTGIDYVGNTPVGKFLRTLVGFDTESGTSQTYLDADAVSQLAQYLHENGAFLSGDENITSYNGESSWLSHPDSYTLPISLTDYPVMGYYDATHSLKVKKYVSGVTGPVNFVFYRPNGSSHINYTAFSNAPDSSYTVTVIETDNRGNSTSNTYTTVLSPMTESPAGQYYGVTGGNFAVDTSNPSIRHLNFNYNINTVSGTISGLDFAILYYHGDKSHGATVEGVEPQTDAKVPDFSGCSTPADYRQALEDQFPELFEDAVTQTTIQPDGSTDTVVYIPVGTPDDTSDSPSVTETTQVNPSVNPDTASDTLLKTIIDLVSRITEDTPTTGTGNTPVPVIPVGSASSLWGIYNPTQAQIDAFGGWLWSDSFIEQIKKLFNNPMESIIGVHKIFASPSISGSGTIKVGYLDSGVSSNIVGAQYTNIDCGSVSLHESFGNVFDYVGTEVSIYLPFIGIQPLDIADVMRSTISVIYHVDVLSGACLAEVRVSRDGSGGTLYQFAGDCAVRYPISSGSYIGIIGGLASATLGAIGSAVSGTPFPALAGASALANSHTNVQHSGMFTGNSGAMGIKKPYLIISRVQSALANNFSHYQGYPANQNHSVSAMNGYFKMADVHLESITTATRPELEEIENLLLGGVMA